MRRRGVLWPLAQRLAGLGADIGIELTDLLVGELLEARHALFEQRPALEQRGEAVEL